MRNIFFKTAVCLIAAIISFSLSASQKEWKDAPGGLRMKCPDFMESKGRGGTPQHHH